MVSLLSFVDGLGWTRERALYTTWIRLTVFMAGGLAAWDGDCLTGGVVRFCYGGDSLMVRQTRFGDKQCILFVQYPARDALFILSVRLLTGGELIRTEIKFKSWSSCSQVQATVKSSQSHFKSQSRHISSLSSEINLGVSV